jgi:hypothetical protein
VDIWRDCRQIATGERPGVVATDAPRLDMTA